MSSVLNQMMIGLPGTSIPDYLPDLAAKGLRSVCIYGENVQSEEQLKDYVGALREVLGPRAIIAIDEEGGEVTRVDYRSGSRFAGNGFLGRLGNLELTERDGRLIAQRLRRMGINLNLAPVADVNIEPANPVIGLRSFGRDQHQVAQHVAAFVRAHEASGVGTTLKHFPGHGNTRTDSHHGLPKVEGGLGELIATQMEPFEAGIAVGASAVMLGHLDVGLSAPSSMAPEVVDFLRAKLGFTGLIVTDAMDMGALGPRSELPKNTIRALLAGIDLVCLGPRTELEELEEIVSLGRELQLGDSKLHKESSKRIDEFAPDYSDDILSWEPPVYPMGLLKYEGSRPSQVIRFTSRANLAVGQVPWYGDVTSESFADPEQLDSKISGTPGVTMVLFRTVFAAQQVVPQLSEVSRERLLAVVPEPPSEELPCRYLVTYGTALPQSEILQKFLSEGQGSNDD